MIGNVNLNTAGADVDGKTFIVHNGTGDKTTTFAPAKGRNWTLNEILDAINATIGLEGVATAKVFPSQGAGIVAKRKLRIMGDPFHTIRGNGTANAELGFTEGATPADDTIQTIFAMTTINIYALSDPNTQWIVVRYA